MLKKIARSNNVIALLIWKGLISYLGVRICNNRRSLLKKNLSLGSVSSGCAVPAGCSISPWFNPGPHVSLKNRVPFPLSLSGCRRGFRRLVVQCFCIYRKLLPSVRFELTSPTQNDDQSLAGLTSILL